MTNKPNVVFIYADDLGRGMLSCYGQKYFNTPHIDRLAEEGMRFTRTYGCALCAPARASIITGNHDCHKGRWHFNNAGIYVEMAEGSRSFEDIRELINNSAFNEREKEEFLPQVAKRAGYYTGQIGKLEWGFATTPERVDRHGWDYHYGYYDHVMCHGFYPPFLFENGERIDIEGNTHADCGKTPMNEGDEGFEDRWNSEGKAVYSQDLFNERIIGFLNEHKDHPFFLYHPSQLPHGPIAVPEVHPGVKEAEGLTDHEKEYASMVLRLDDTVGLILEELERLEILDNTLVIFSADNGHALYYCNDRGLETLNGKAVDNITQKFYSAECGDVFDGNNGMAGLKRSNLEGGVKVPFIARVPRSLDPQGKSGGTVTEALISGYDMMVTLADLGGVEPPADKDGLSYLPVLTGKAKETEKDYVVFASFEGPALVTRDNWKIRHIRDNDTFELYNLSDDYEERTNLVDVHKEKAADLALLLMKECDGYLENGYILNHKYFLRDIRKELTGENHGI